MRFYDLTITASTGKNAGKIYQPTANGNGFALASSGSTFTSFSNGKNNPGALNIEADFIAYPFNRFQGNSWIRIYGVGLQMISQATDLNGANFTLSAGMKPGLPLATIASAHAGPIAKGSILQAFGNWQGTLQTLELIVNPLITTNDQDISFKWPAGKPLASALFTTLRQAFPGYNPKIDISDNLVLPATEDHHAKSLEELSEYLGNRTKPIGAQVWGNDYDGVQITLAGNTIHVYDYTVEEVPIKIDFLEMIGQPTWVEPNAVSFKTVLRNDISCQSQITFPQGIAPPYVLTTPSAGLYPNSPASSKTSFQGNFVITEVHQFMNFRQADADSWNTTFRCSPVLTSVSK